MKIGLNTYSFRKELKKPGFTLENVWDIAEKIGGIEGIELLDHHIPGFPDGDIDAGIKKSKEQIEARGWKLYGLGPHVKVWKTTEKEREKEALHYKKWIDLCADNGIPAMRTQVGGPLTSSDKKNPQKGINVAIAMLEKALPYAHERGVQIGLETHWTWSSFPPFLDAVTEHFKDQYGKTLGIIFDWGNFWNKKVRYGALDIAVRPHNQCYSHTKIYNFGKNFQQRGFGGRRNYDTVKIVDTFKKNNFQDFFSIEFEGKQNAVEGVYKSVNALKYAISGGKHKIDEKFDWKSLLN